MNLYSKFKLICIAALVGNALSCTTTSISSHSDFGVSKGDQVISIAVLPDTQYYTHEVHGGNMQMFHDQIDWIRKNRKNENIAYVVHLGDITDRNVDEEWLRAKDAMYKLEEDNIPYGMAVGNHDEAPNITFKQGNPNTLYTKYFGTEHFKSKPWYGGQLEVNGNSDNHFDLFSAGGQKFIAVYFAYNEENRLIKQRDLAYEKRVMAWTDSILNKYADRKAIMITHSMLNRTKTTKSEVMYGTDREDVMPTFTKQGTQIYNMAKKHPNVFLMLGGHIAGEGFRRDEYQGNVIKTYLADYQSRQSAPFGGEKDRNGGNGLMRLMRFNLTKQTVSIITFAPRASGEIIREEDGDSQFTEPLFR
ncbi:MAG: hypothetical protein K0S09_1527 [Sphingobacteriaceae bacterium]|jgi:hypothetical protein|nr:hypothetical protein [Sphingobacteriaceae bacterium]